MPKRHPSLVPLSREHHHGLLLAFRIKHGLPKTRRPHDSPQEQAADTVHFFKSGLASHFAAETDILFPSIRAMQPQASALLDRLIQEHTAMRELVHHIARQSPDGSQLTELLASFGTLLEQHIRCEERDLFPVYEAHVSEAEATRIEHAIFQMIGDGLA
ncbi:MAG: hemerythrin domain-containing protein [Desulfurellaceae bacterium]|nr:hemerythrin domain-containing protein [Desulfurellaceae bacterium]